MFEPLLLGEGETCEEKYTPMRSRLHEGIRDASTKQEHDGQ